MIRAQVLELTRPALVLSKYASVRKKEALALAAQEALLAELVSVYGVKKILAEVVALIDASSADRELLRRHHVQFARSSRAAIRSLARYAGHGPWAGKSKHARTQRFEHIEWVWHFNHLQGDENALRAALYSGVEKMRETLYGGRPASRRRTRGDADDARARFAA